MNDFTIKIYLHLLETLLKQGISFSTFEKSVLNPVKKEYLLRHDVDQLPGNSLEFAKIQNKLGIKGSYYFRAVTESWDEDIIRNILEMGHEVGYHYEDLSFALTELKAQGTSLRVGTTLKAGLREQGEELEKLLVDIGIKSFRKNLEKLRKIVPVKTICMHGSPMSRLDNRLLWKYYDYHDFGIVGEPYFDINFNEVLYLTDTGRRWDGGDVSVRDKASGVRRQASGEIVEKEGNKLDDLSEKFAGWKVQPVKGSLMNMTAEGLKLQGRNRFRSTKDIINAAGKSALPKIMMMTFHPQRWTDKSIPWVKELVWQNVKNVGKFIIVKTSRV